jgi:hypothetical protein
MAKARGRTELDDELRNLHGVPLGEFTAARNALAKKLQKEGAKDEAAEVKSLPKPSVSAWAVNLLFHREPERMESLLEAGEKAREGLRAAISQGRGEALRDALDAERKLRDELRRRAVALVQEDTGKKPGQAIADRIGTNLDSLALSPDAAEAAERGWLSTDLAPPGFEVLAGLQLAARPRRHLRLVPSPRPEAKPKPAPAAKTESARRREEEAEKQKREREEERRRERIARLEEKAAEIRGEAETARREADRADQAVAAAERELEQLRRRLESAREEAQRARQRADRAAERLARAEKDVEGAER